MIHLVKMRHFFFLIFFISLLTDCVSQVTHESISNKFENTAFKSGEYLKYEVNYGLIKGGEAEMSIDVKNVGGDWYYHGVAVATTTGVAAKLFTIYDIYETFIDISDGLPIKATRNIKEEAYRYYNEILFRREDSTLFSVISGQKKVPPYTLDVLSAFYFSRRYLFKKVVEIGDTIQLLTYFDDKLYDISLQLDQKQKIKTKFGKIEVLMFKPIVDNILFTDKNQMEIWFTNDPNFVPVKIRVDLPVGKIHCRLIDYSGLKSKKSQLNFR